MPLSKEPDGGQLTSSEELQRSESMGVSQSSES